MRWYHRWCNFQQWWLAQNNNDIFWMSEIALQNNLGAFWPVMVFSEKRWCKIPNFHFHASSKFPVKITLPKLTQQGLFFFRNKKKERKTSFRDVSIKCSNAFDMTYRERESHHRRLMTLSFNQNFFVFNESFFHVFEDGDKDDDGKTPEESERRNTRNFLLA